MENGELQRKKFDYKWVIVGLCFLMVFTALGFCSSSKSLYITAITDALGISRSAFSINDSCRFITTSVINIFFGTLIAKFGAKKLIGAGFICLIVSSLIYSFATNIFVFYIGGVFLGLGMAWTTTTMVGAVVNKWCKEGRGTIMGAILASNGIGAALAIQVVSPIINQPGNPFGYRDAYKLVALILAVVGALVMIFFRNNPKGEENQPTEVHKKKKRGESWEGIEFSEAVKKAYFFGALICIFFTGMILQGITGISTPHMYDCGLDPAYVAMVLSLHSIALTIFKFLVGFIYDRCGLRIAANISFLTSVVVMLLLSMVTNSVTGKVLAMIYGIFSSLALPLETIMLPIFAGDLFGDKSFNKILGIIASVNTAGYALGAPAANLCYDLLGSYNAALYISSGIMVLVMIGMHFVISAANKQRKIIMEKKTY